MGRDSRDGDSWHESRPGILHAYDADDIRHELWNSLELPARDDCGEYSKMAPPTIANGQVYLASFGSENVGTGQFCVYGLLPTQSGTKLPLANRCESFRSAGEIDPHLEPGRGRKIYRVVRTSTLEPQEKTIATGLTTPSSRSLHPSEASRRRTESSRWGWTGAAHRRTR